jgi:hypothetical protein
MPRIHDDERCTAEVIGGGRGYAAQRCRKRALLDDPERLCRVHRVERDGFGNPYVEPEAEQSWVVERDLEWRLNIVSEHLNTFFGLKVDVDYDPGPDRARPTGRLVVDVDDLLRILDAEDFMPRRTY